MENQWEQQQSFKSDGDLSGDINRDWRKHQTSFSIDHSNFPPLHKHPVLCLFRFDWKSDSVILKQLSFIFF